MYFDLNDFFDSLRNDRFDERNPKIPEGLVDISRIIDLVLNVMSDGRMIKSDSEYAFGDFVDNRLRQMLLGTSEQDRTDAILALLVIFSLVLKQCATQDGVRAPEETLLDALDEMTIKALRLEFSATPTVFTSEGRLRPNFLALSPFQMVADITPAMLTGFMKRNLTPHLPFIYGDSDDSGVDERGSGVNELAATEVDFVILDGPLEGMIADPLNGFDEFHHHFMCSDAADYEGGLPVEGLEPEVDPSEDSDEDPDD